MSSEINRRPSVDTSIDLQRKLLPADPNAYLLGCRIGVGTHGLSTLWLAKCVDVNDARPYIIRKTDIDHLTSKEIKQLQHELQLSSRLLHPNILSFSASFVGNHGNIWTVFPLYNFGSCQDMILAEFHHGLPLLLVAMILRSVVLALEYIHQTGFIHRSVKASHILLNSCGNVCLTGIPYCLAMSDDNKSAHEFPDHASQVLPWIAPEILQQNVFGYNDRSDIYSLGITAVELVTGVIPFSKLKPTELLLQKLRGVVPQLPDKATIEELQCDLSASQTSLDGLEQTNDMMFSPLNQQAPSKRIRSLQQFVDVCLQADPSARPSSSQLRQSTYIRRVKRKMKDKDCPTFVELLKPLSPILEFIPQDSSPCDMELVSKVSNVSLDDEDNWVF